MFKPNRIKWANDKKSASEKQVDYVRSLVNKMKRERPAATVTREPDRMMWELWEFAEVPDNLTATEASCLIDLLRYTSWNSPMLASEIAMAIMKEFEDAQLSSTKDKAIMMLALSDC